jgi:hypothetical protein
MFDTFLLPSILMGLGIAIDVAIATVARFRDGTMGFKNWTLPVALTHILLPAIGYYGWWYLGSEFEGWRLALGLIAFTLIALFIYEAFCEWIDSEPVIALSWLTDRIFGDVESGTKNQVIMIMAVSMDALWSGPAKAAQAESGGWTPFEVFVSFFIAGAVVAVVAQLALIAARALNRARFEDTKMLATYLVGGKYFEATILFGFGVLSLWNALAPWLGLGALYPSIAIAAALMLVLWLGFYRRLYAEQLAELEQETA